MANLKFLILPLVFSCLTATGTAQIVPDATLPVNSTVIPQGNTNLIEGGTQTGNNLFHSFAEFSVPTGTQVIFNNKLDIQNIFTRITGNSISQIDGILQANGSANLFLLNPNGIIFGPNAQLNIGGSFIATTANSLLFADGTEFSATKPNIAPVLTINVPIGLQFNSPSPIAVQGSNLAVATGKTLAILGGDLSIFGSNDPFYRGLTAGGIPFAIVQNNPVPTTRGGRVELGSIERGIVNLNSAPNGFNLDYHNIQNFGNIQLTNLATVDTSGTGGGEIQITGRNLQLNEGSRITSITLGSDLGGNITVNTTESVAMSGNGGYDDNVRRFVAGTIGLNDLRNGFFTVSLGAGSAGNTIVNTHNFTASNGTYLAASTFGSGRGGNVTVNATGKVELSSSFIATGTSLGNGGDAGDITINTRNFRAIDNAIVTTSSLGAGKGGDLSINAVDAVELIGSNPIPLAPGVRIFTGFFTSGLNTGKAGELQVNTERLTVRSGAGLAASSFFSGDGGNITVNASQSVDLIGASPDGSALSSIAAVTEPGSSGKGGNLTLNTGSLVLRDGGRLSVRSRGTGRTGNLDVKANSILLHNEGGFEGTAVSGEGADINVRSLSFQLFNSSFISATAGTEGGTGNGGNINIYTTTLVVSGNSDINANAFLGKGGNILIDSFGIFRSPNSSITASSQSGVSGVVEVRTINSNVPNALVPLFSNFAVSEAVLATDCTTGESDARSRFTPIGTGGLPSNPYDALISRYPLASEPEMGNRKPGNWAGEIENRTNSIEPIFFLPSPPSPMEEARGIVRLSNGEILLITETQMQEREIRSDVVPTSVTRAKDLICSF